MICTLVNQHFIQTVHELFSSFISYVTEEMLCAGLSINTAREAVETSEEAHSAFCEDKVADLQVGAAVLPELKLFFKL